MSDPANAPLIVYGTHWCADCFRVKTFLKERGVTFEEVDIEDDPASEDLVIRVNDGKRRVPTLKVGERYFACSPFRAQKLADELGLPLNKK